MLTLHKAKERHGDARPVLSKKQTTREDTHIILNRGGAQLLQR